MDERNTSILEAVIKEYIKTGEPVSSSLLYERHHFGIKPAMIRFELNTLTDTGFLEQPHHSAGRVPTNKGYEFFAERALGRTHRHALAHSFEQLIHEHEWEALTRELASEFGIMAIAGERHGGSLYKEGLEELLEQLEWDSKESVMDIVRDYETIEDRVESALQRFGSDDFLEVFIGDKSPLTKSNALAVFAGDYDVGDNHMYLFAIGPKRMDYERITSLFKGLKRNSTQTKS